MHSPIEIGRVHVTVCLPADSQYTVAVVRVDYSQPASFQCMRHLRRWIASEEAHARNGLRRPARKGLRAYVRNIARSKSSVVPVLTEETIEGAGAVEDRQIIVAFLGHSRGI